MEKYGHRDTGIQGVSERITGFDVSQHEVITI